MKFRVQVADPQTGEESNWDIECSTVQDARARANSAGYLVASIQPIAEQVMRSLPPHPITTTMLTPRSAPIKHAENNSSAAPAPAAAVQSTRQSVVTRKPPSAISRSKVFIVLAFLVLLAVVIGVEVTRKGKVLPSSKSNKTADEKPTPEFLAKVDEHTRTLTDLESRATTFMRKITHTFDVELPERLRYLDVQRGNDGNLDNAVSGQTSALLDLEALELRKEVKREVEQLEAVKQPKGDTAIAKLLGEANGLVAKLDHLSEKLSEVGRR